MQRGDCRDGVGLGRIGASRTAWVTLTLSVLTLTACCLAGFYGFSDYLALGKPRLHKNNLGRPSISEQVSLLIVLSQVTGVRSKQSPDYYITLPFRVLSHNGITNGNCTLRYRHIRNDLSDGQTNSRACPQSAPVLLPGSRLPIPTSYERKPLANKPPTKEINSFTMAAQRVCVL